MSVIAEFVNASRLQVPHGFFTRCGGVSTGPFASLNCSLSGQDSRDNVLENRARAARAIGADPACLVGINQVHGVEVAYVSAPWTPGNGPRADAMVTDRRGIALGIVTGDCAPVLFADTEAGVVGAAHAGWRGAVAGVLEATVTAMAAYGAAPERITAAIGPCIRQQSYEVGADLRAAVLDRDSGHDPGRDRGRDPGDARFFVPGRRELHWQFDLPGYCAARITAAGVTAIEVLPFDTLADEARFFSHRRRTLAGGGLIGHQISIIALA